MMKKYLYCLNSRDSNVVKMILNSVYIYIESFLCVDESGISCFELQFKYVFSTLSTYLNTYTKVHN